MKKQTYINKDITLEIITLTILWLFNFVMYFISRGQEADKNLLGLFWIFVIFALDLVAPGMIEEAKKIIVKKMIKFIHHFLTITISLVILASAIIFFFYKEIIMPEFLQMSLASNIVVIIYVAIRFIRGFCRIIKNHITDK